VREFSELLERIDGHCRRAGACPEEGDLDDLLTEGYLAALNGESRSRRLAERLVKLAQNLEDEQAANEARRLAIEKRTVDQRVKVLRARLSDLRISSRGAAGDGRR
jgi:hypothetical protein